ncbi:MAG: hypothetical protein JW718_08715 [Desulfovibrionaceae bacterium]|nr:hypothetical protein [Desulfovibrionaceae bacterium]
MAPHEKIFVDSALAEDENHGPIGCHECHGGNPADPDWKTAHKGVVKDPTYPDPTKACGDCHPEICAASGTSLHVGLAPFKTVIDRRAGPDEPGRTKVDKARQAHCQSCHSSCGQCHVSRPEAVEGGLLEGHLFLKRAPEALTCTACHGSRMQKEYYGKNPGLPPDVHKTKYFKCTKCHQAAEMHGDGKKYADRFSVANRPRCLDCHQEILKDQAPNAEQHQTHKDLVSCQVCHSVAYKNCYNCHFGKDKQGYKYFKCEKSDLDFKIGFNPLPSEDRPQKYVTLRHIPIDQQSFKFYVDSGLPGFDSVPTWKLAAPHNIQRKTPQNKTCNACHGNKALFLRQEDVWPRYVQANKEVIVPAKAIPEPVKP